MTDMDVVTKVLDGWNQGIDQHRPADVAAYFTQDALFQGAAPSYSIGRGGVEQYYDGQPVGLIMRYEVKEVRPLADGVLSAYVDLTPLRPDGTVLRFRLTVVLVRQHDGQWLISHYHVSNAL